MTEWKNNPKIKLPPQMEKVLGGLEDVKSLLGSMIETELQSLNAEMVKLRRLEKASSQLESLKKNPKSEDLKKIQKEVEDLLPGNSK